MILFFSLTQITIIATLAVLIIQGITHIGHLFRIKQTGANIYMVLLAIFFIFSIVGLTLYYTYQHTPMIGFYLLISFAIAFGVEIALRLITHRTISKQILKLEKEIFRAD